MVMKNWGRVHLKVKLRHRDAHSLADGWKVQINFEQLPFRKADVGGHVDAVLQGLIAYRQDFPDNGRKVRNALHLLEGGSAFGMDEIGGTHKAIVLLQHSPHRPNHVLLHYRALLVNLNHGTKVGNQVCAVGFGGSKLGLVLMDAIKDFHVAHLAK